VLRTKEVAQGSRGFSLIEMVVASAIFAIAAAVAFILYTAAQKSYKAGENFTDQQQATRVAFDRMLSDLRLAGFNWNPDGDSTRIDEQVEGAWDTAVTIRGDFDFEDPTASTTPESALPGTAYTAVSTGNDEIVTYVLAKPGVSGPATLALRMDVNKPRTKTLQNVTISNVALVQDNPPYTLYRVSLVDATTFPSTPPNGSAFVFEPVAENIRSMTFQYYDDGGTLLSPYTPANAGDDIGGADAGILTRARIRRIAVNLVGMTPDEDPNFVDTADAAAQHFRKFDLSSDVNAENLGRSGVKDIDITPPPAPTNVSLVSGHCNGILVKWDPPSSSSGVTAWAVKAWPSGTPTNFTTRSFTHPHQEYGVVDYDAHAFYDGLAAGSWCFQVQAKDSAGNQSGWAPSSGAPCATLSNATTPSSPTNVRATGNGTLAELDSQIKIQWDEVRNNTGTLTNEPDTIGGTAILRDMKQYTIMRATASDFSDGAVMTIAPALGPGALEYTDTAVQNCQTYYYRVLVEDTCTTPLQSAWSTGTSGRAQTNVAPSQPTGLNAARIARNQVRLDWPPVTSKTDGTTTYVGTYKVWRAVAPTGTPASSISDVAYSLRGTATPPTTGNVLYVDNLTDSGNGNDVQQLNQGNSFYYKVSAADLCGNESLRSDAVEIYCAFNGTLSSDPANGSSNAGNITMRLAVSGSEQIVRARVRVPRLDDPNADAYFQEVTGLTCNAPCNIALGTWDSSQAAGGTYTIYWEVETQQGCVQTLTTTFNVMANLACQITPTNPNLSPTSGKPSSQNKELSWDIVNNAGKPLEIYLVEVAWTNILGPHTLVNLEFPNGTPTLPFSCLQTASTTSASTVDCSYFPLGLYTAQTINMSLSWDLQIVNTSNVGEFVTIRYSFQDDTGTTGTCEFTVKPDLTIQ
jgi:prepilin-type N-terminal cleavage/methylation domain-containing protein